MFNVLSKWKNQILFKLDYRRIDEANYFEFLCYKILEKTNNLSFIQIGANDGKMSDPLYFFVTKNHDKIKGIALEPMKDIFVELKHNYRNYPNITPLNLAIHTTEKEMILYRIDPDKINELPEWTKGIASFNKAFFQLSKTPDDYIISEIVSCISIDELVNEHNIEKVDLLQIDTEGYDIEIIKSINFNIIKPVIIRFEHGIESSVMSKETLYNAVEILHNNGYDIVYERYDATAYRLDYFINL